MRSVFAIVSLWICLVFHEVKGKVCESEKDCDGENECCLISSVLMLPMYGVCEKLSDKGKKCSTVSEKMKNFGGKYLLRCPCQAGMVCAQNFTIPRPNVRPKSNINSSVTITSKEYPYSNVLKYCQVKKKTKTVKIKAKDLLKSVVTMNKLLKNLTETLSDRKAPVLSKEKKTAKYLTIDEYNKYQIRWSDSNNGNGEQKSISRIEMGGNDDFMKEIRYLNAMKSFNKDSLQTINKLNSERESYSPLRLQLLSSLGKKRYDMLQSNLLPDKEFLRKISQKSSKKDLSKKSQQDEDEFLKLLLTDLAMQIGAMSPRKDRFSTVDKALPRKVKVTKSKVGSKKIKTRLESGLDRSKSDVAKVERLVNFLKKVAETKGNESLSFPNKEFKIIENSEIYLNGGLGNKSKNIFKIKGKDRNGQLKSFKVIVIDNNKGNKSKAIKKPFKLKSTYKPLKIKGFGIDAMLNNKSTMNQLKNKTKHMQRKIYPVALVKNLSNGKNKVLLMPTEFNAGKVSKVYSMNQTSKNLPQSGTKTRYVPYKFQNNTNFLSINKSPKIDKIRLDEKNKPKKDFYLFTKGLTVPQSNQMKMDFTNKGNSISKAVGMSVLKEKDIGNANIPSSAVTEVPQNKNVFPLNRPYGPLEEKYYIKDGYKQVDEATIPKNRRGTTTKKPSVPAKTFVPPTENGYKYNNYDEIPEPQKGKYSSFERKNQPPVTKNSAPEIIDNPRNEKPKLKVSKTANDFSNRPDVEYEMQKKIIGSKTTYPPVIKQNDLINNPNYPNPVQSQPIPSDTVYAEPDSRQQLETAEPISNAAYKRKATQVVSKKEKNKNISAEPKENYVDVQSDEIDARNAENDKSRRKGHDQTMTLGNPPRTFYQSADYPNNNAYNSQARISNPNNAYTREETDPYNNGQSEQKMYNQVYDEPIATY